MTHNSGNGGVSIPLLEGQLSSKPRLYLSTDERGPLFTPNELQVATTHGEPRGPHHRHSSCPFSRSKGHSGHFPRKPGLQSGAEA